MRYINPRYLLTYLLTYLWKLFMRNNCSRVRPELGESVRGVKEYFKKPECIQSNLATDWWVGSSAWALATVIA